MSSSSDDQYDEAISSDKEMMESESDEQLLNDEDAVAKKESKPMKKHKKSYDPRYAFPTNEEKQMMRDADMDVEVSMIELEVRPCECAHSSRQSSMLTV